MNQRLIFVIGLFQCIPPLVTSNANIAACSLRALIRLLKNAKRDDGAKRLQISCVGAVSKLRIVSAFSAGGVVIARKLSRCLLK